MCILLLLWNYEYEYKTANLVLLPHYAGYTPTAGSSPARSVYVSRRA